MLHYGPSLHPARILTAVTEDPFDKSVSASVLWQAQLITASSSSSNYQKIYSFWIDRPQMSNFWHGCGKRSQSHASLPAAQEKQEQMTGLQLTRRTCFLSTAASIFHVAWCILDMLALWVCGWGCLSVRLKYHKNYWLNCFKIWSRPRKWNVSASVGCSAARSGAAIDETQKSNSNWWSPDSLAGKPQSVGGHVTCGWGSSCSEVHKMGYKESQSVIVSEI